MLTQLEKKNIYLQFAMWTSFSDRGIITTDFRPIEYGFIISEAYKKLKENGEKLPFGGFLKDTELGDANKNERSAVMKKNYLARRHQTGSIV